MNSAEFTVGEALGSLLYTNGFIPFLVTLIATCMRDCLQFLSKRPEITVILKDTILSHTEEA